MMNPRGAQKCVLAFLLFVIAVLPIQFLLTIGIAAEAPGAAVVQNGGTTIRASLDSAGVEGEGASEYPAICGDGHFIVFHSYANNLTPDDTNFDVDVFIHDLRKRETQIVSINSSGEQANGGSVEPAISDDGRIIAYASSADNLAVEDSDAEFDLYVHDLLTKETTLESVSSTGKKANGYSAAPSLSGNGRFLAFASLADNLVAGDSNGKFDIFVRDRQEKITKRISVSSGGQQANDHSSVPAISANGRFVTFVSISSNLVGGDTNNTADIFVHDLLREKTELVSVNSAGGQADSASVYPDISRDGRLIVFSSAAGNLVPGDINKKLDVFLRDRESGETSLISVNSGGDLANDDSFEPAISADGLHVVFASAASNLVLDDTNNEVDIFVHHLETGETERLSLNSSGDQANGSSFTPAISEYGQSVSFMSSAKNLVPQDGNEENDVFVHYLYRPQLLFFPVVIGK